jgi:hypothetical protein
VADFVVRWADFRGGDFGRLDPSRANNNQFFGRNVMVYGSGLLGPRAGWKQKSVTGLPNHSYAASPAGMDVFDTKIVVALDKLYDYPMVAPSAATAFAAYPAGTNVARVDLLRGDNILYSVVDGKLFKHVGHATAQITTPQPLAFVVRWGMFMVGVDRNVPWRLWHSTVDASGPHFDQWGANNYLDVGNADPIVALQPIYNTLYCGKPSGWWAVSGVLGDLASVREIVVGNGPVDQRYTSVTTDNRVVYWPVQKAPAWFNGERVYIDDAFFLDPRTLDFPGAAVIVTPTARTLLLCGENVDTAGTDMLVWRDSAWTAHDSPFVLGALTPADVKAGAQMPDGVIFGIKRPSVVGDPVVSLSWHHDLDRPAHASDTYASPIDYGDDELVLGSVALPAWFDGAGRQCRVRSLIVQFRKWPSGIADSNNGFRCQVDALGAYEGGRNTVEAQRWVEPSSICDNVGTIGISDSWRVNFGDQGWGNGFQVRFPVMRGVAIQEVVALVDVRKERT